MFWRKSLLCLLAGLMLLSAVRGGNGEFDDEEFGEEPVVDAQNAAPPKEEYHAPQFKAPVISSEKKTYFVEYFADKSGIGRRWFTSVAKKEGAEEALAKYNGEWAIGTPPKEIISGDYGLVVKTKARHHAIAAALKRPFEFSGEPLVIQYAVAYTEGQECGGGYLKLISSGSQEKLEQFTDKTPYTIMFGPDKCGTTSKVHFILRHQNPKNGTVSEHHAKQPSKTVAGYFDDKLWHLYTLVIQPDNEFQVLVDNSVIMSGNLLKDLEPAVSPPGQIPDPEDKKPADWDEREQIVDPEDKKPEDWDESQPREVVDEDARKPDDWLEDEEALIPDPEAKQPEDWDREMDGEWEAKKIPNPQCEGKSGCGKWTAPKKPNPLFKGKWSPKKIKNPAYKGKWSARLIDNPHHFEADPYKQLRSISAIGIELWTMSQDIVFDDILITDSVEEARHFAEQTFDVKKAQEKLFDQIAHPSESIFKQLLTAAEDRPWLWAVYVLAVLIPLIIGSIFFFGRRSKPHPKKTDAQQADSAVEEEEEPEEEDEGAAEAEEARESEGGHSAEEEESAGEKEGTPSKRVTRQSSKQSTPKEEQQPKSAEESAPTGSPSTSATTRRARQRRAD